VIIVAGLYLLVMLVNMVAPTGLSSPRGYFNLDWITLIVMIVVFIVGAILFVLSRGGKEIDEHLRDDAEKPAAAR
jgi:cbb3-type cytochrome oxidase subunit 1